MLISIFVSPPPTYANHSLGNTIQVSVTSAMPGNVKLTLPAHPNAWFDNNLAELLLPYPAGASNLLITFHFTIHRGGTSTMATQFTTFAVDSAGSSSMPFPIAVTIL
jgi:hypothetical protein